MHLASRLVRFAAISQPHQASSQSPPVMQQANDSTHVDAQMNKSTSSTITHEQESRQYMNDSTTSNDASYTLSSSSSSCDLDRTPTMSWSILPAQPRRAGKELTVHFADESTIQRYNSPYKEAEGDEDVATTLKAMWYSCDELQELRRQTMYQAAAVVLAAQKQCCNKAERRWWRALDQAYRESGRGGLGGTNALLSSDISESSDSSNCRSENEKDEHEEEDIEFDTALLIGLETWAFRPLKVDRRLRRRELYCSVAYWQQSCAKIGSASSTDVDATTTMAMRDRQVRKASLALSQQGRLFARCMGEYAASLQF